MKNKVNPNISPLSQPKLEHNMIGMSNVIRITINT